MTMATSNVSPLRDDSRSKGAVTTEDRRVRDAPLLACLARSQREDVQSGHLSLRENGEPLKFSLPARIGIREAARFKQALERSLAPALEVGLLGKLKTTLEEVPVQPEDTIDEPTGESESTTRARLILETSPGSRVGFAGCTLDGFEFVLEVGPKLEQADFLGLMLRSGTLRGLWPTGGLLEDRPTRSIAHLLVWAYARALDQLLVGRAAWSGATDGAAADGENAERGHGRIDRHHATGLRRLHERRDEVLRARVRGRIDLPKYLRRVVKGRPDCVPCSFQTLRLDNRPNQILRWALHQCLILAKRLAWTPLEPREQKSFDRAVQRLQELEYFFAGVQLQPVRGASRDIMESLPQAFEHYETTGALPLALIICSHSDLGPTGANFSAPRLAIPMYQLFEWAFAEEMRQAFRKNWHVEPQQEWEVHQIRGGEPRGEPLRFRPDVLLRPRVAGRQRCPIVLDTKWKELYKGSAGPRNHGEDASTDDGGALVLEEGDAKWSIRTADVAQVLNYAYLASNLYATGESGGAVRAAIAILVYPVEHPVRDDQPFAWLKMNVDGIRSAKRLSVFAVPWCVGVGNLEAGTDRMIATVREIAEGEWI